MKEHEELHARAIAIIEQRAPHLGISAKHDLAGRACYELLVNDTELAAAVMAEVAKLPAPPPQQTGPRLSPLEAHVAEKCREWESTQGKPATPEQRLTWAREHPDYKAHEHTTSSVEDRNAQVSAAMDRYERETGQSRHNVMPSKRLEIAAFYARQDAPPARPLRARLKAEGREASPTLEELVGLEYEDQAVKRSR